LFSTKQVKPQTMHRITISIDESLADQFDRLIRERGYENRSEAIRDILRKEIGTYRLVREEAPLCVATLSYVYNHHERRLADRLTELQHHAHDLVVSSMHVHLNHDDCLETVFLRGKTSEIRMFANTVSVETGVRHSALNLIPVQVADEHVHHQGHFHVHPHS
jgi:CopG family transcriptional regulator, nickel-responsive regulator